MHATLIPTVTAFAELADQLAAEGYVPAMPSHLRVASLLIDAECATEMRCPDCNRVGLQLVPFTKPGTTEYRDLARCCRCEFAEEV